MQATVKHINQYPPHVPVIAGAAEVLVTHRQLRTKYETNQDIKTWSCWFLLKALTQSGKIQRWRKQWNYLKPWLQCSERTFYRLLDRMQELKLAECDGENIILVSYEKAAEILDIIYSGTIKIQYNPQHHGGKQIFQYLVRGAEIRERQLIQLNGFLRRLNENLANKNVLHYYLVRVGADDQRLHKDPRYFQEQCLQLLLHAFKEGKSELLLLLTEHRPDINRSVETIKKDHCYKSTQSVSYMKGVMKRRGLIECKQHTVNSEKRSRLYIPDATTKSGKRDGYKWNDRTRQTMFNTCDQIIFKYEMLLQKTSEGKERKAA